MELQCTQMKSGVTLKGTRMKSDGTLQAPQMKSAVTLQATQMTSDVILQAIQSRFQSASRTLGTPQSYHLKIIQQNICTNDL